jgi:phosphoenolpyruvate carboxylase
MIASRCELHELDLSRVAELVADTVREREGGRAVALLEELRGAAVALRAGQLSGGRDGFAQRICALELEDLALVARAFTLFFHLVNLTEEQHRIQVLRTRDRPGKPPDGSIAAAGVQLRAMNVSADDVRGLLGRLLVMPVLTAHPTEARRRSVLDHLSDIAALFDLMADARVGAREQELAAEAVRRSVLALYSTEQARSLSPTPFDEVRAGLHIFERTLLDVTPAIYRELEDALAVAYPGESFDIGPFLRWGTWIGGDRDGNPYVTHEVTRQAFAEQRARALGRHIFETDVLGRVLSMSERRVDADRLGPLLASIADDRARWPDLAPLRRGFVREPWRDKLAFIRARLGATRAGSEARYPDAGAYKGDLELVRASLIACGLGRLARGRIRDAIRSAQVFGFHLASVDLRQHSAIHERVVGELLAAQGAGPYALLPEATRVRVLAELLERDDGPVRVRPDATALSPEAQDLMATLEVVARAHRELGPEACQRYVISFTSSVSDVLEVLFLTRAAGLAFGAIRPIPLFEQIEDLDRASVVVTEMLAVAPVRAALGGELEVMLGYSDSGKQAGYVPSQVALYRAEESLASTCDRAGVTLTLFHGRGGAVGRGGGPGSRAILAQPPRALRGRIRVTEQGETITARYGRLEIARRDLEQMVHAVLVTSLREGEIASGPADAMATAVHAATCARAAYRELLSDPNRMARYASRATPMRELVELPIASRPAARRDNPSLEDLRAIPWVFAWNQSRHGLPGWFGLGRALEAVATSEGLARAQALYEGWPFFRALIDNAQLALARADMDVAEQYSRLADADSRQLFGLIRDEFDRTCRYVQLVTRQDELLAKWPTLAQLGRRRNPYVDVLSHAQIELLRRLAEKPEAELVRIREILFVTVSGIAAGLQTAG